MENWLHIQVTMWTSPGLYSAPRAGEEPVLMPPDLYRLWMQGKENISV